MIFYEVTKKGLILPPRRGQHASCRTPCLVVLDGGRLPWRRSSRRERIRDVPLAPAPCWWCSTRVALWQNAMAAPPCRLFRRPCARHAERLRVAHDTVSVWLLSYIIYIHGAMF
jgi:hypothetical protein